MYVKECFIRNVGPLASFHAQFPLNSSGNPKPIVLVGPNGGGKTILLSYLVDALVEFTKASAATSSHPSSQFRISGITNQRIGATYGLTLIQFADETSHLTYVDKTGRLDKSNFFAKFQYLENSFGSVNWTLEGPHKEIYTTHANEDMPFTKAVICYFPSSRNEKPHWLHKDAVHPRHHNPKFDVVNELNGRPILIEHSGDENSTWLLDVFLESLISVDTIHQFGASKPKKCREHVESILRTITQCENVHLELNLRDFGRTRLGISSNGNIVIPSLEHLSTGQSMLFNLFTTIIRYADEMNLKTNVNLADITGIVMVDEIDVHLHSEFQYAVLPKLISMFPKIQFITTSHSPLFLLGMDNVFGHDGYTTLEMPSGKPITVEHFSEFSRSYEYYSTTQEFEKTIKSRLAESQKPLLLTEGETDPAYIATAMNLLGYSNLLNKLDIKWVGRKDIRGNAVNTGKSALDRTFKIFESNPKLLTRRLLLLYDCDANKSNMDSASISIRSIPLNGNNKKQTSGIENLLPEMLFTDQFYKKQPKGDGYVVSLRKTKFCDYVCNERRSASDFVEFVPVVEFIQEFLKSSEDSQA